MFGNFYQGKNVFVTGHTGFKGSWLSAWLLKLGANVTGYALPPLYDESHFELLGLAKKLEVALVVERRQCVARHVGAELEQPGRQP